MHLAERQDQAGCVVRLHPMHSAERPAQGGCVVRQGLPWLQLWAVLHCGGFKRAAVVGKEELLCKNCLSLKASLTCRFLQAAFLLPPSSWQPLCRPLPEWWPPLVYTCHINC